MASLADKIALGLLAVVAVVGATAAAARARPRQLRGGDEDDDEDDAPDWGEDPWFKRIQARRDKKIADVEAALATSPALIVSDGYREYLLITSGEMHDGQGGKFRVTTFADDGPMGHDVEPTMKAIAKEISEHGYKTVRPATDDDVIAWTTTPKFVEGSKRVAFVQAVNALSSRAHRKGNGDAARDVERAANKLAAEGDWDGATLLLQQGIKDLGRPRGRRDLKPVSRGRLGAPTEHDQSIAWVVKDSAARAKAWRPGKVFIADVYDQLKHEDRTDGMTLDEFKRELIRLHRAGALTLSRADLVAAMPAADVARSESDAGGAEFHFVRLDA